MKSSLCFVCGAIMLVASSAAFAQGGRFATGSRGPRRRHAACLGDD